MSETIIFDQDPDELKPRVFAVKKQPVSSLGQLIIKTGLVSDSRSANKILLIIAGLFMVLAVSSLVRALRPASVSVIQIEVRPGASSTQNISVASTTINIGDIVKKKR